MRRREFITLISGAAAWPLAAHAQQPAMPVIGLLNGRARGSLPKVLAAFHQGLNDTGYIEAQNVAIEYRFAENRFERLPALADDLVRRQVSVIAATGARWFGSLTIAPVNAANKHRAPTRTAS